MRICLLTIETCGGLTRNVVTVLAGFVFIRESVPKSKQQKNT